MLNRMSVVLYLYSLNLPVLDSSPPCLSGSLSRVSLIGSKCDKMIRRRMSSSHGNNRGEEKDDTITTLFYSSQGTRVSITQKVKVNSDNRTERDP